MHKQPWSFKDVPADLGARGEEKVPEKNHQPGENIYT